ncbi:unnamed protein product [Symbiodinium sp. CCMP2592]|nr:unnamed protein product [Symbiodinium sp. CCMP2592]
MKRIPISISWHPLWPRQTWRLPQAVGRKTSTFTVCHDKPPSRICYADLTRMVEEARHPLKRGPGTCCRQTGFSKADCGYRYRSTLRGWSYIAAARAIGRDKQKGRQSDVDMDHLLDLVLEQEGLCAYSGIPMELLIPNSHWGVSIERIDTQLGYMKGNCCLIAAEFNTTVRNPRHEAGTSCGSAQWSRQKVQRVAHVRTEQVQLHSLQEDIAAARLRPVRSQTASSQDFRGPDSAGNWRCGRCGNWLEMDQFAKRTASKNGLQYHCKKCGSDFCSAVRQTLRGHVLDMVRNARHRATKHPLCGSSLLNTDDVLEMLWLQGGRCYYSGVPLHCAAGPADWVWSIERLDNSVTYTRENCVLIAREFQTADQSRNKAKFPVFGTAQWSISKAAHIWGPYVPGVGDDCEVHK